MTVKCDGCPCFNESEYEDHCNLGFSIKGTWDRTVSNDCKLDCIKLKDGTVIWPEEVKEWNYLKEEQKSTKKS
jgi:hypothetical protein